MSLRSSREEDTYHGGKKEQARAESRLKICIKYHVYFRYSNLRIYPFTTIKNSYFSKVLL